MGPTFADSEFGETVESQLTLGTASLLGIFFGLVMVCGIFFGFGYSLGRRNTSALASAAPASKPAPEVPSVSHQVAEPQQPAAITPVTEPLIASLETAPAAPAMTLPRLPAAVAAQASGGGTSSNRSITGKEAPASSSTTQMAGVSRPPLVPETVPVTARIPKPSAFAPVVVVQAAPGQPLQRIVAGPQFTSQSEPSPYFVWTPPFDVHRSRRDTRNNGRTVALVNTLHTRGSRPALVSAVRTTSRPALVSAVRTTSRPALVLQIAALSRQDDAEVLATSLRKGGFTPSIKSGVEDALYHVEVGPFDRETAAAARQRLIARGYNAILR